MGYDLDPLLKEAVRNLQLIAGRSGIPILLVGAFARDILFQGVSSVRTPRRTKDVDFAVMVKSWEEFERMRQDLLASGLFLPSEKVLHKVLYKGKYEVDLVPFGELVGQDGMLRCWPEDFGKVMNLCGFLEAFKASVSKDFGGVDVRTLTVESLVVLKIIAWNDRKELVKDAEDLAFLLMEHASIPERIDMLWNPENLDLVERIDQHELQLACLLGRCVGRMELEPNTRSLIIKILERETGNDGQDLALGMRSFLKFTEARKLLAGLLEGIRDVKVA